MKLIAQTISIIRTKGYSLATEKTYTGWIKRYIRFHNYSHPNEMGENEIGEKKILEFLSDLATNKNVSSTSQNQALNALSFLYKSVRLNYLYLLKYIMMQYKLTLNHQN